MHAMSGGGTAAPRRKVIGWFDLVTLNGEGGRHGHEQRGVVMRRMPGNKLGVRRANGTMFEASPDVLSVVDRSQFRRGDIVALESDRGGQIGVVTGASTSLDLVRFEDDGRGRRRARPQAVAVAQQQGVTVMVSAPESQEVRRVTELVLGEYVVSGAWLGRVVEVSLDVDVVFDDGALCRLSTGAERKLVGAQAATKEEYDDLWSGRQTNSVLYPGQRVVGCSPSVFRQESRWMRGYWKPSRVRGTVSRVGVAGVLVHWVASKHLGIQAPSAWQPNPQKLARFPYPTAEASPWHVGDRCFFRTPRLRLCHDDDHALAGSPGIGVDDDHGRLTRRHIRHGQRRTNRPSTSRQLHLQAESWSLELERPMSVAGTRTTVDVLWQDGTRQCGLPSRSLVFFVARNDYDFFPGQHVISRAAAGSGIVRSFNCKDKTVLVSWFEPAATCLGPAGGGAAGSMAMERKMAVMSAYDLARDLDANFFYGDVVLRLQHPNPTETTVAEDDDLSWVGHVVDLCCEDGHVQVKWGDGNTSKVLPHEIALVKQQSVSEMLREIGDWSYEDDDMEQEEVRSSSSLVAAVAHHQPQPVVAIAGSSDDDRESDIEEDGPAFPLMTTTTTIDRVRSVARALIRQAGDLFAQAKRYRAAAVAEEELAASPEPPAAMEDVAIEATKPMSGADSDGSTSTGEVKTGDDDEPFPFPRFDVVQSPPDHHFLDSIQQGTAVRRKWTKRVQKEWKILDKDLPDTIYARAFEDRTDLLRVVMVGASGTPYHDGLFFFDLHLPPLYPAEPPLVSYRSFGLHVNPNLYPSGTVCLSLLNTFGGQEGAGELWSPEASTILQVVVSIQGLVLTARPYYNEPAHGAQPGTTIGVRNELPYSENAYLLSLQTMLHLLRRPPAGFEEFVRDHFRRRGQHVIRACEAYQDGCLVGTLDEEGHPTEGSGERPCSAGFRLALRNVMPRLLVAFASIDGHAMDDAS